MTEQDWLVVAALFIFAVTIAYVLGARRGTSSTPSASRTEATSPSRTAVKDPEAASTKGVEPAKAKAKEPAAKAKEPAAKAKKEPAPKAKEPTASDVPVLAKLEYEEDEEIDPTKIGGGVAPKRAIYQPPVQKIVYDEDAATDEPTRSSSFFLVSATAQTDKGRRRKRNEDSLLVLESDNLFVVADGMGGYGGGDLASQLAVSTIRDAFRNHSFEADPHDNVPKQASELARAIQMANAAILETAKGQRELDGMGTTVCAARFSANKQRVYIGHVGDSRCYRMRNGALSQLTADHTMADHGVKGPAAAHLSRAVGIWPTVPIDIIMAVPVTGDVYLLCSDGLTKMVNDETIAEVLRGEPDLKVAVEALIESANTRGGKDNITAVLVRVVAPTAQASV